MNNMLNVSSNPHVRDKNSTSSIMLDVLIALIPATIFGIYNAGDNALYTTALILATVTSAVVFEYIYQKCMKQRVTVGDFSAAVTGLLLALNLPSTFPIWMAVVGSAFAIIVVKQLFGGLGQNIMNPALAARCFLVLSFTGYMSSFVPDGVTGATPLETLSQTGSAPNLLNMFIGNVYGTIGETSVIAILIGATYLLVKRVIDFRIPLAYLLSFSVFILILGDKPWDITYLAAHLCGGGLMLGAFFMATDYVTSPITPMGRIVFGILLGIMTGIFREFSSMNEGVSFAIIFCNLLVPQIDKLTRPRPFGAMHMKKKKEGK